MQGVTVGEDMVSGLMLADDFVGMCETPEGLQQHILKALHLEVESDSERKEVRGSCMYNG